MNKEAKSQKSNKEKIILVAVAIISLFGITYMAYDYVTTMEQLDDLKKKSNESLSLTEDSTMDSVWNDTDR